MSVATGANLSQRETVTATVRGVPVQVACAAFCTTDHSADLPFIEDLTHENRDESVAVPVGIGGRTEDILAVRIAEYPFAGSEDGPVVVLDATGSGETAELSPTRALAELDRIIAHASRQRQRILDCAR